MWDRSCGWKNPMRLVADEVERGVIALAGLKQMRKTRLVHAFEAHCVEYFWRCHP
jgi:hypothetical protein